MTITRRLSCLLAFCLGLGAAVGAAATLETNPVRRTPPSLGPETQRLIVGFRTTANNAIAQLVSSRRHVHGIRVVQAQTTAADVAALTQRTGIALARSRQITPSMHVLLLPKRLYGGDVTATLARLRADPAVAFADVDARRYPLLVPDDPLFQPTPAANEPASGQWYLATPSTTPITLEGNSTVDLAATDAVSAWNITTGSTGVVIADVDTGVRFDHPDLLRAGPASLGSGYGGRLLPGYDFVGEDQDPNTGAYLGTYLIANDGDGWDPDPSDPGDWISQSDTENTLFSGDEVEPSSWHGTRVVGVYGAIANNDTGIAGLTWGPWILPVRALGKGGGHESDIIAGIEWAAGLQVMNGSSNVPLNPYPADIINLSLGGGTDSCPSDYQSALSQVTGSLGVLVVIAAGNGGNPGGTAPVEAPANCSASVAGVIAVAGLRNVGTKVGYSSFGPEVGVSAPAGNCVQTEGDCLRSIDTTTNLGSTVPGTNSYTNEVNANLGTSFATPIVSGIAGLMRSVNANLTPAQLVARLESSATAFPANTGDVPVCPANDASSGECSCPPSGQCGDGMADALSAVNAALKPIGVIEIPATIGAGSVLDASASVAACNPTTIGTAAQTPLSIASFAWTASPSNLISAGANTSQVTINPGSGGTLTLTITDSAGNVDVETVDLTEDSASTTALTAPGGTSATACPTPLSVVPVVPTVSAAYAPASVTQNTVSTLTITLTNTNPFDLTQASFTANLPSGLTVSTVQPGSTTCTGALMTSSFTATSLAINDAIIPAAGSCTLSVGLSSATVGTYTTAIPVNALVTGPAGANTGAASAALTVTAPSKSGGGGALGWSEVALLSGLVFAGGRWRRAGGGRPHGG
jgi:serine protease